MPNQNTQEWIRKYAGEAGISESRTSVLLETLRTHALQKLAEREKFKSSGLTLKDQDRWWSNASGYPEFVDLPDHVPVPQVIINDAMIAQVTAMGFEPEMSRRTLVKYNADVQKAIDELVNCGGSLPPPILGNQSPSTSAGSSSNTLTEVNSDKKVKEEKEAIDRLVSDLPDDEVDYLDVSLEAEKHFLQEYKALLLSLIL